MQYFELFNSFLKDEVSYTTGSNAENNLIVFNSARKLRTSPAMKIQNSKRFLFLTEYSDFTIPNAECLYSKKF